MINFQELINDVLSSEEHDVERRGEALVEELYDLHKDFLSRKLLPGKFFDDIKKITKKFSRFDFVKELKVFLYIESMR